MDEINNCKLALTDANTRYKTLMIKYANREYEYRKEVAKREIELRQIDRYPGNLCYDIARGDEKVAKLRLERDIAKIDAEVCKEGLKNVRSELEALRSLLTWQRVELQNS